MINNSFFYFLNGVQYKIVLQKNKGIFVHPYFMKNGNFKTHIPRST